MGIPASLGIDLGTSGVKVALVDAVGRVLAAASRTYAVSSAFEGWAESDPHSWSAAARAAVLEVMGRVEDVEVRGVGVAGQMHGVVLVDQHGAPTRPAMLWPDSRAAEQLERWFTLSGERRSTLANPIVPGMTGPMLAWVADHEHRVMQNSASFVLPKDWLRSQLAGQVNLTDASDASATLLWDVRLDDWARDIVEEVGVPVRLLPVIGRSSESCEVTDSRGRGWGLTAGVPVSVGCADVAATLLGADLEPGRMMITVGTGAQVLVPGVKPVPACHPMHHLYRATGDDWYAMSAVMNAGLALQRVLAMLNSDWEELYRSYDRAAQLPIFLPHFSGERLPVPIPSGRGGWAHLGLSTGRELLLASALEGVAFAIRHAVEALPETEAEIDIGGGGTRSEVFQQLLADVLQRPLRLVEQQGVTVVGASRLGWRVAGSDGAPLARAALRTIDPRPSPELEERYRRFVTVLRTGVA